MKIRVTYANVVSTLALILALSGGAYAANGGSLILGRSNSASSLTEVRNPQGTAFSFRSKSGRAPFTVNANGVKVPSLNADKVDGYDAAQLMAPDVTRVADSESFSANQGSVCNASQDEPGQCRRVTVTVRCPTDTYLVSAIAHSSTHNVRANGFDDQGVPTGFETEDRSDYPAVTGDDFESQYIADSSDQPTGMKFHHWSSPLGQGESESGTVKLWVTCAPEPEPLTVATEVACDENGEWVLRVWATTAPGSLAFSGWIRTESGSRSVSIAEGGGTDEPLEMTGNPATSGTVNGTFSDGRALSIPFTVRRPPCP
jgi:hypothetical protein